MAEGLVRTIPAEDLTNGFFVSCFLRKESKKRPADVTSNNNNNNAPSKKKKKNNKKKKAPLTA